LESNRQEDQELLFSLDQDPEVMRFINGGQPTTREALQDVMMPRLAAYTRPDKGWGMWGVFDRAGGRFYGWVLVRPMHFFTPDAHKPDLNLDLELGWRFFKAVWGKGIATEAASHVMNSLHELTGVNRFSAIAVKENAASIRIMQKLGMRFIESGLHKDPLGDMVVDTYGLSFE
jgi:RimJ/RimL family protein N-acetyltransferase